MNIWEQLEQYRAKKRAKEAEDNFNGAILALQLLLIAFAFSKFCEIADPFYYKVKSYITNDSIDYNQKIENQENPVEDNSIKLNSNVRCFIENNFPVIFERRTQVVRAFEKNKQQIKEFDSYKVRMKYVRGVRIFNEKIESLKAYNTQIKENIKSIDKEIESLYAMNGNKDLLEKIVPRISSQLDNLINLNNETISNISTSK